MLLWTSEPALSLNHTDTQDMPNENSPPGQGDRSLSATTDTYRDRDGESQLLAQRLQHSTASVIGIAGPRGTGKSSLAKRVLAQRAHEGAFTQLIHAPTSYEPAEFLVAVSQQICDEVIAQVDKEMHRLDSVSTRWHAALRRIVVQFLVLLAGALALAASGPAAVDYVLSANFDTLWENLLALVGPAVVWLAAIGLLVVIMRLIHQFLNNSRVRLKVGLRSLALEFSERLQYQSTRSVSARTGITFLKFASALNVGRSLSDRPLSVPRLTDQLSQFLAHIAEAYGQPVVICLDELDKIAKPDDLNNLLRGIKGVLGRPKTHFILTVSEDALTKFATRHWADREMVESAFEDILFLNCVNLDTSRQIVGLMHHQEPFKGSTPPLSMDLMWLFGGGIPREIKRSTRMCLETNQPPAAPTTKPYLIWKTLFGARLKDIGRWTLRSGHDPGLTYEFIQHLEVNMSQLTALGDDPPDREWAKEFVQPWITHIENLFNALSRKEPGALALGEAAASIVLGGSAIVYTQGEGAPQLDAATSTEPLYKIFEFGRCENFTYTKGLLESYLTQIGLP